MAEVPEVPNNWRYSNEHVFMNEYGQLSLFFFANYVTKSRCLCWFSFAEPSFVEPSLVSQPHAEYVS